MRVQPHNRVCRLDLDQPAHLSRLHSRKRLHDLRRQLFPSHRFVVAHVHPEIVLRNCSPPAARNPGSPWSLSPSAARLCAFFCACFACSAVGFSGGTIEMLWKLYDLRLLIFRGVLHVITPAPRPRHRRLRLHIALQNRSISSERRMFSRTAFSDPCISDCKYCSYSSGLWNCFLNSASASLSLAAGIVSFRCPGFLVHELLENDHLQRPLPDRRLLLFGKAIMLPGVGEDREHLTQQIAVRQHRPVHPGHRLIRHHQWRTLRGNRRPRRSRSHRSRRMRSHLSQRDT